MKKGKNQILKNLFLLVALSYFKFRDIAVSWTHLLADPLKSGHTNVKAHLKWHF
jgi:hypothetical protein